MVSLLLTDCISHLFVRYMLLHIPVWSPTGQPHNQQLVTGRSRLHSGGYVPVDPAEALLKMDCDVAGDHPRRASDLSTPPAESAADYVAIRWTHQECEWHDSSPQSGLSRRQKASWSGRIPAVNIDHR
jgi:hypothetical protein